MTIVNNYVCLYVNMSTTRLENICQSKSMNDITYSKEGERNNIV